ncbi:Centromeric protein E, putative [Caldicellulosiruptor kronotskyensis 2002]|uniref:Centromeric protein E, putative n=1 Tax=Caldicellulosiruptor kronotskyensis (strain DSM 18902 / VKM B-2412 / 2002) TaxID=632348 RepID=E4SC22_CALK2|nr:hypothetical protein [Caldicellulosiruptor kronotskyensis]ADQ44947.1 Centromeric protein E, putative [Caldicellulosiruptor kronotskyensis 2002]
MEEYIDKEKAIRMLLKIIDKERENLKTKKYKDRDMVEKLKKIIEEELRK